MTGGSLRTRLPSTERRADAEQPRRCAPTLPVDPSLAVPVEHPAKLDAAHARDDALSRRFRIDGVLGAGGMGVVVAAHHLALDKRVAIKLMRPELRTREDLVRRFLREARAAARLTSRHVTRVLDVNTLDDGAPYIVMEYLDGVDLAAWLRQHGPAPVPLAAAILVQVCDAIAEAHAAGIVHRDLKPANLFMTHDRAGQSLVKVLDLGICKLVDRADELRTTSSATTLGTPVYMAPEQLSTARHADARSDIWSLGVILHELVTGRVPFPGARLAEVRACVATAPYPAIDHARVPGELDAIIARCLEKDPAARFACVTDLAGALARFAPRVPPDASVSLPVTSRTLRTTRWRPLIGVVVAVLSVGGLVQLSMSAPAAPGPGPDAAPPVLAPGHVVWPSPTSASSPAAPHAVPAPASEPIVRSVQPPPREVTRSETRRSRTARTPSQAPGARSGASVAPAPRPPEPIEPAPVPDAEAPRQPPTATVDPLATPY